MGWILDHLEREWSVIAAAPITFFLVCALTTTLVWWILDRYVYRERLATKDDLIRDYKDKLSLVSAESPLANRKEPTIELKQDQYAQIVQHLSRYSQNSGEKTQRHVDVYIAVGAPGNEILALQLVTAMQDADWHATYRDKHPIIDKYRLGLWLAGSGGKGENPLSREVLKVALAKAGIESSIDYDDGSGLSYIVLGYAR
jgi:hypothetical protein